MRIISFAKRNIKELVRDPLSFLFSILLPIFLLFIFQQFKIPSEVYKLENFTPGIIIFSFSFISLFVAGLVAGDRETSLLARLYSSPMKPIEYILGYTLAMIPLTIIQSVLMFTTGILLGLEFSINIILAILILIPISILFIALGILIGSLTSAKASSGCGSVIVQLVAFTSGMYFSSDMVGKFFSTICNILPFTSTFNIAKGVLLANYEGLSCDVFLLTAYIIGISIISIIVFKKKMISDKK